MKKIIYILLVSVLASMAVSSCTEEAVTPNTEFNGGGLGSDPK